MRYQVTALVDSARVETIPVEARDPREARSLAQGRGYAVLAVRRRFALPFGLLFLLSSGPLAIVLLGLFGGVLTSSFAVSVVLAQAYLPRNAGMASGLIVGFAIGLGGAGVAALGWVADRWGLPAALWISALMPLVAFALTRLLPAPRDAAA